MTKISSNWSTSSSGKIVRPSEQNLTVGPLTREASSHDLGRPAVAKDIVRHTPQSSRLLMRNAVKNPRKETTTAPKYQVVNGPPQAKLNPNNQERAARA